ncbi:helix-turn-helix transcriptional regulator [Burkholderia guangdongensis]|uniref:helix-turn-helix transcriptional regulator n=1 Tax=Burkholderia guangdongensis TaxID=1792500 RepID=UPI0015CA4771|nr:helix-turn-helix transcriptional regulator [Burkholderia guangdongensis]
MPTAVPSDGGAVAHDRFDDAAWTARELDRWLGLVYQGPTEATPWGSLLEAIRADLDASFTTLVLRNPGGARRGLIINASVHGPLLPGEPSYSEQFYALCPFVDLPAGEVFTADSLFGEPGWRAHDFYRQYLEPLDLRYILGANLRGNDGVECAFFVSRAHRCRDFDASERARIAVLLPHLQRAVALHATLDVLDAERALYAGTIDRLDVGTAILDEDGRVLKHNSIAERLFERQDGLCLRQDQLHASCPLDERRLQKTIQAALEHYRASALGRIEATTLSRAGGAMPLNLLLRPLAPHRGAEDRRHRPAVAVFVRDPKSSPQTSRDMLHRLYRLTPMETEIALLLVDGNTLDEAATATGITKNTARAHLRGIFAKTGATRQAVLVKTLLNSVVSIA